MRLLKALLQHSIRAALKPWSRAAQERQFQQRQRRLTAFRQAQSVGILLGGHFGDTLIALPLLKQLKSHNPERDFFVAVHPEMTPLCQALEAQIHWVPWIPAWFPRRHNDAARSWLPDMPKVRLIVDLRGELQSGLACHLLRKSWLRTAKRASTSLTIEKALVPEIEPRNRSPNRSNNQSRQQSRIVGLDRFGTSCFYDYGLSFDGARSMQENLAGVIALVGSQLIQSPVNKTPINPDSSLAFLKTGFAIPELRLLLEQRRCLSSSKKANSQIVQEKAGPRQRDTDNKPRRTATIVFAPEAGTKAKRWPIASWRKLSERLKRQGFEVRIVGSIRVPAELRELGVDWCGRHSPAEAYLDLQSAKALVTTDSYHSHLGSAVSLPTLVIASAANDPQVWQPESETRRVLALKPACHGCQQQSCRHLVCMNRISVEAVDLALRKVLVRHPSH